jgi:hypothetical protein
MSQGPLPSSFKKLAVHASIAMGRDTTDKHRAMYQDGDSEKDRGQSQERHAFEWPTNRGR